MNLSFGEHFKEGDFNTKKTRVDTFLNKVCDVYESKDGIKMWFWKGLCLKQEMLVDSNTLYEYASFIDENYVIKVDEFKVPQGVKIKK